MLNSVNLSVCRRLLSFFLFSTISMVGTAQVTISFDEFGVKRIEPIFDYENMADTGSLMGESNPLQDIATNFFEFYESNQIKQAMTSSNQAIEDYPSHSIGYYLKGLCFGKMLRRDSALYYFTKVLTLGDVHFTGPVNIELGYLYLQAYRGTAKAGQHFESAIKFMPDDPRALHGMAYCNYRWDKKGKALEYAELAVASDQEYMPPYFIMLEVWKKRMNYDMAHQITLRMLEASPDNEMVQLSKAILYFDTGENEFGDQILKHVMRENPKNFDAIRLMVRRYYQDSKVKEGFNMLMIMVALRHHEAKTNKLIYLSDIHRQIDNTLLYVQDEIRTYDPIVIELLYEIVEDMAFSNEDEARKKLSKLESKTSYVPTGMLMIRAILFELDRDSYYWRQDNVTVSQRDSTLHDHMISLGSYYYYYEFYDKAEEAYTKVLHADAQQKTVLKLRAYTRLKLEKYKKAIQDFNIYLDDNFDLKALEQRALCYKKLGYLKLAADDLQSAFFQRVNQFYYDSFLDLFTIKLMLGDTTMALVLADSALSIASKAYNNQRKVMKGQLFNLKGLVHMATHDTQLAIEDFSNAIGSNPYFDLPYFNKGKIEYDEDDYQGALRDFDKFVELTNDKGIGYFWRGKASLMLQNKSAARRDFKMADKKGVAEAREWYLRVGF